jgi:acyl carrier protein|tara:strand:- start:6197 stop:6430 length:234 start_codon:yes stop_codon:yes gene_type:complete
MIDLEFMKSVFESSLDINSSELTLNSEFEEVPGWDSLGHIKIISEIENRLDLEFDIDEIVGQDTIEKLIDMVKLKLD